MKVRFMTSPSTLPAGYLCDTRSQSSFVECVGILCHHDQLHIEHDMTFGVVSYAGELKRIMVFGSTGQGNSSLVRLLSQQALPDIKISRPMFHAVDTAIWSPENTPFVLVDTAGLDVARPECDSPKEMIFNLADWLQDFSRQGCCLALMVTEGVRLTEWSFVNSYKLFVQCLLKGELQCLNIAGAHHGPNT